MNYETATNQKLNSKLYDLKSGGHAAVIIPNYCTDWNATMPLAVEHGVSLLKANDGHAALYKWDWIDAHWSDDMDNLAACGHDFIFHADENPLRAIVICLIKVLESKNEQ